MKKLMLAMVLTLISTAGLHAQSIVQGRWSDANLTGGNPDIVFPWNLTRGNTIVVTAGCGTAVDTCNVSIPTDDEGNTYTLTAMCTATGGVADRTIVYTAFNIAGGTKGNVRTVGTNVQFEGLELSGVNAVDVADSACNAGLVPNNATVSSHGITTTHANELVLGLGTATRGMTANFTGPGPGWTNNSWFGAGTQIAEYQNLATPATSAATANVQGGSSQTFAMAAVAYYFNSIGASGSPNPAPVPVAAPAGSSVVRVSTGGPYTDSLGQIWSGNEDFTGGFPYSVTHSVANTNDPYLYQNEHAGVSTYNFSVPAGTYTVTLKFAEIYWSSVGQRIFNVAINASTVLSNFDIVAQANGADIALDRSFTVNASSGIITIQFLMGPVDLPKISAIQIVPATL